jgi:hypothetical protein
MQKILTFAALGLIPLNASAVNCVEYFAKSGNPTYRPIVEELTPSETSEMIARLKKKDRKIRKISSKPHLSLKGDVMIATFPDLAGEDFQVFGVQSPRGYLRPDFHEVQGFARRSKTIAAEADKSPAAVQASLVTKSGLLKTRSRAIVYESEEAPTVIPMKTNEIISGLVDLGENRRIVITARADEKIGFHTATRDPARNYLMEVYLIEPTGHAFIGFRVRAGERAYPKVDVLNVDGEGLLLTIDDEIFQLALMKKSGARALGIKD